MTERSPARAGTSPDVDLEHLRQLVYGDLTAEFASLRDGKPECYPVTPLYDEDRETLLVSSPPAFAGKVENVREDPKVAVLFHDDRGEYLLTGDARLRDADPESNGEYVADLLVDEPPSDRRRVHRENLAALDSVVGRLLMGWYAERVVAEIEPRALVRVGATAVIDHLPAWDAVGLDEREADRHERAMVVLRDEDGYPAIQPVTGLRVREEAVVFEPEPPVMPDDGQPACLLLHWCDDDLDRLGQRLVRGRFRTAESAFEFVPASTFDLRRDGLLDEIRFVLAGKLRTRAYHRESSRE